MTGRAEGEGASLSVADEGVGIAADDLPHVFDSFFRARRGDRVAPGTGLGLAIARGMVEAMGGRQVGMVYGQNDTETPIVVRLQPQFRSDAQAVRDLPVGLSNGQAVRCRPWPT